jgi:PQQ system protein
LDKQNHAALGRVLGTGSIAQATERADGTMEATIRINEDELCWDPAILVMPHGGDIELTVINDDKNTHAALFPSNGDRIVPLAAEPLEGQGETEPRRPRLLLVQLARRQR